MKVLLNIIVLVISLFICNFDKNHNKPSNSNKGHSYFPFSTIDTLKKYIGSNKMYKYDSTSVYVGRTNNIDYGIQQLNDSISIFYQVVDTKWKFTDSITYAIYYVESTDLNADGYEDLVLTYGISGAGGNYENVCFIYYPQSKTFKHNSFYDLPNIHYEKSRKYICSAWFKGGGLSCAGKEIYEISGDSLVLTQGIIFCPDENEKSNNATLEYYVLKNRKEKIIKKIENKYDKLYYIFDTTYWNSENY